MDSFLPYAKTFFSFLIAISVFVLFIQIWKRELVTRIVRPVYWGSALVTLGYLSFLTYMQYNAFLEGLTLGVRGKVWFVGYARVHFWNSYLISFVASLLVFWLVEYFNRKRGEVFFEKEETYIIALGVFLVGYPGFFFYIISVLCISIFASLIFGKRRERFPLYYLWMPVCTVLMVVVNFLIMHTNWWATFRF
jgi:hypothetical protein